MWNGSVFQLKYFHSQKRKGVHCIRWRWVLDVLCFSIFAQSGENYRIDDLGKGLYRIKAIKGTLSTVYHRNQSI